MNVYFVRHGQSELNEQLVHQYDHTPLSIKGKTQADLVAKRIDTFSAEMILTSPHERARQTSETIRKNTGLPLEISNLLTVRRRPSEIIGQPYSHPTAKKIKQLIKSKQHLPDFRYSDEESFFEIRERAYDFLQMLPNLHKKTIIAVTHGYFLRMLFSVMWFGRDVPIPVFEPISAGMVLYNTSISVCEFRPERGWRVYGINDVSHLPTQLIT